MKNLLIAIIGSGVVGFATGNSLKNKTNSIIFIDKKKERINFLRKSKLKAFNIKDKLTEIPDIFFICTPTPTRKSGPDISSVLKSCKYILKNKIDNKYFIVAVRSTVPVGTNKKVVKFFEINNLRNGIDFDIVSFPEFLRERNSVNDSMNPRLIVIGSQSKKVKSIFTKLYKNLNAKMFFIKPEEAEIQKYIHNIYNATKISFFNEFRKVCLSFEINPDIVFPIVSISSEASWNTQYGIKNLGPFDGKCLPKDTEGFLRFIQKEKNMKMPILKAIIQVNNKYGKK